MKVYTIQSKLFASNNYIVTADGKTCIVIDIGDETVLSEASKLNLQVQYVLLTHGHADHICGASVAQAMGAKIGICKDEVNIAQSIKNLGFILGVNVPKFEVDFTFNDGDTLNLCGLDVKVIQTAGHTIGSVCYLIEDCIFSGDTLFCDCFGRTDFPSGDEVAMANSLNKLFSLQGDYRVFAGHDEMTTLSAERLNNGFKG